jgi:predicted RNase H-like HicB family nuclease
MLTNYEIIIYWSAEDNAFLAEIPELPGCMADGQDQEEALKNIKIVMAQWLAQAKSLGRAIPVPKGKLMYA